MNDLIERLRDVKWEPTDDAERMSDDLPQSVSVGVPYKQAADYADGLYGPDDLAAIWNACVNAHKTLAQQPPSAPVGVDAIRIADDLESWANEPFVMLTPMRKMDVEDFVRRIRALAQQPAAVDGAMFRKAPCYMCGYNGAGYFQPETHPCAALYHAAQPGGSDNDNQQEGDREAEVHKLIEACNKAHPWGWLT